MNRYIGVKTVRAKPMTRQAYNDLRGWALPVDENGSDVGFLVEYEDGGKANLAGYDGYVSWSPADVFGRAYRATDGMTFGQAIEALKTGKGVTRTGWNGKGMFLLLIQGSNKLASIHGFGFGEYMGEPTFRDAIFMRTADNQLVPWTVAQSDALAEDWLIA